MTIMPRHAWGLARLLIGQALNGKLENLPESLRRVYDHLASCPPENRGAEWSTICATRLDGEALALAIAAIDPTGPPPEEGPGPPARCATLADLSKANDASRFVWLRWIVRGHFTLLSSEVKVGKTRLCMELARRLWFGLSWPDGQAATLSKGTKTLWVPGDRHQDELRDLATAYGLPPEAVLLNADPDGPYGGWSLDDPENVEGLARRIEAHRPGLVVVDTVWKATRRRLCREDEVNALMDPLVSIVQAYETSLLGLMHLSKDGETLGRRLEGIARAVIKLSKPDPQGQPARRKLWVDIANFLEPSPLGMTIHDDRCEFDSSPPKDAPASKPGRAPEKTNKAIDFLVSALSRGDCKAVDLVRDWEALGESKGTLFNARDAMVDDGRLAVDTSNKPQIWHLNVMSQEEDDPED